MKQVLSLARIWATRLAFYVARPLPIRNRVVLATSKKARIDGNLESLRGELARRSPAVSTKVIAYRPESGLVGKLRTLLHEMSSAATLATARVFVVDDYFFPIYAVRRRPRTCVIQTWHAVAPVKRSGYEVAQKAYGADDSLTSRIRIHSNYDYCLVGSRFAAEKYSVAFRQPLARFVWDLGIPRTDLLFGDERIAAETAAIRSRYAIPTDRRAVLYAPTFRGDDALTARFPDFIDFELLRERLAEDHVLLVRRHPFVRQPLGLSPSLKGFVIDVSDYPEINQLMPVADVLVTDYSSSIYEYSMLGRPIAFLAPDRVEYERHRGLFLNIATDGPGPVFETTTQLADYLRAGNFDLARVEAFRDKWFAIADGRASERVVDRLISPALSNSRVEALGASRIR